MSRPAVRAADLGLRETELGRRSTPIASEGWRGAAAESDARRDAWQAIQDAIDADPGVAAAQAAKDAAWAALDADTGTDSYALGRAAIAASGALALARDAARARIRGAT